MKKIVSLVLVFIFAFSLVAFSFAFQDESEGFWVEAAAAPRMTYQIAFAGSHAGKYYCNGAQVISGDYSSYYKFVSVGGHNSYVESGSQVSVFVPYGTFDNYKVTAICASSDDYPESGHAGSATLYVFGS